MTIKGMILCFFLLIPIVAADYYQIVLPRRMMTMRIWHTRYDDEHTLRVDD